MIRQKIKVEIKKYNPINNKFPNNTSQCIKMKTRRCEGEFAVVKTRPFETPPKFHRPSRVQFTVIDGWTQTICTISIDKTISTTCYVTIVIRFFLGVGGSDRTVTNWWKPDQTHAIENYMVLCGLFSCIHGFVFEDQEANHVFVRLTHISILTVF